MFFVEARYHRNPKKAAEQIKYIAHREEGLPDGERRELFGIGGRYRACRGDEMKIRKLFRDDARGLKSPVYFRFILTVDNRTAERFAKLDGRLAERVIRDAVQKTFRSAARETQGVFAIHQHGGEGRPAHPHVHALLSPRFENGAPTHISPKRIQRVKERWEVEVLRGLERQEKRLEHSRDQPAPPARSKTVPARFQVEERIRAARKGRYRPRRVGVLTRALVLGGELLRILRGRPRFGDRWRQFNGRLDAASRNPERAARQATFRLMTGLMPKPIREAMWLARGLSGVGLRRR
jgi:curved DNA-binding protein CbpA